MKVLDFSGEGISIPLSSVSIISCERYSNDK